MLIDPLNPIINEITYQDIHKAVCIKNKHYAVKVLKRECYSAASSSERLYADDPELNDHYKVTYRFLSNLLSQWKELGLDEFPTFEDSIDIAIEVDGYFDWLLKNGKEGWVFANNYEVLEDVWNPSKDEFANKQNLLKQTLWEKLTSIINGITQQDINDDCDVVIMSAYGGAIVGYCKVSEVFDVISQEERTVNTDYYMCIMRDNEYCNHEYDSDGGNCIKCGKHGGLLEGNN